MRKNHFIFLICLAFFCIGSGITTLAAQELKINKVEPPCWWTAMGQNSLQLMLYGENMHDLKVTCRQPNLKILKIYCTQNGYYSFIDVQLGRNLKAGEYNLLCANSGGQISIKYSILKRTSPTGRYQGFNQQDVIYLITPDRFANGDTSNDFQPEMRDKIERSNPLGRHGGDIQGIIDKLDYLQDLGVTALWINPLIENDMTISYHGYGATDLYRIDPRFGTNDLFCKMVDEAHKHNLKIILDHVSNHVGIEHPWMKNLPMPDWINGSIDNHQLNHHGKEILRDIHGDSILAQNTLTGWFVSEMPDLNQKNPYLANYLIQNTLWWIEISGIDGIREDTYPYVEQDYLSRWAKTVLTVYPKFNIVGEVWIQDPAFIAPYQQDGMLTRQGNTHLPCVTDYGLFDAFGDLFYRRQSIATIYKCLSHDFLYPNPYNLLIFIDNHDVLRLMDVVQGDVRRFKMALQMLFTLRGIPQIYYGTEIGLRGGPDHGLIRADFPGGFSYNSRNAFTRTGRTNQENELFDFLQNLLSLRKRYPALMMGKMIHLPVIDEFYVYFRILNDEKIMIIVNNKDQQRNLDTGSFSHQFENIKFLLDIGTGAVINYTPGLHLPIDGFGVVMYKLN
jgi:glycosidase